jgi:hypothetical protein
MGSFKISGFCEVNKHDGLYEYDDYQIIGSVPWASESIDFTYDIGEGNLEQDEQIVNLKDGKYHVFFIGDAEISGNDYGDGYESELTVIVNVDTVSIRSILYVT